jgi:hypothetical protein
MNLTPSRYEFYVTVIAGAVVAMVAWLTCPVSRCVKRVAIA